MKKYKIAVVGATGVVGQELLQILEQRSFPVEELVLFASSRSIGKIIKFRGEDIHCRPLVKGCFEGIELAFFDASDAVSKEWVPEATKSGCWAIDNSATFRMDSDIPLVVPEINGDLVRSKLNRTDISARDRIISGPNCSTVQLVLTLKPLRDSFGLKRVVVSTYQSTSGAGLAATQELKDQTISFLESGKITDNKLFSHQIAFNCIPHIGGFKPNGYTSEEHKIMEETKKILSLPDLRISATAVRVPTLKCHGESVNIECLTPISLDSIAKALKSQNGVVVQDETKTHTYPMGLTEPTDRVESGTGKDPVYVGRIRLDESADNACNLWIISDNIRKGAALNAVQIGELIISNLKDLK
jgi:aspartate-semialdehyde dehydrogenase